MRHSKTLRARAAAIATALGLALGGGVVMSSPAHALTETSYGFQATAYGARVLGPSADLSLPRLAFSYIYCTRLAGKTTQNSLEDEVGLPLNESNPVLQINAVKSVTRSYRDLANGITGASRGTSTIGSLVIGGIDGGPELGFDGLKTTSTAWATKDGKLHARNDVDAGQLKLTLPTGTPIDQPLQDLIDAIDTQVIDQVIDVLSDNLGGIEIPGLGKISLLEGFDRKVVGTTTAFASSFLIRIDVYGQDGDPDTLDDNFQLNIGRSFARITKGVKSGVMAGVGVGGREVNRGGLGSSGDLAWKELPCEGTRGKVRVRRVASAQFGSANQATATDMAGSSYGVQQRRGKAYAWTRGKVGKFDLDGGTLVLEGVVGRTNVQQRADGSVVTSFAGSRIDRILVNGQVKARDVTPANASRVKLGTIPGVERIRFFVRDKWRRGGDITAVKLVLTDPLPLGTTSTADLGFSRVAIKRY